jgi:hypothetical protein
MALSRFLSTARFLIAVGLAPLAAAQAQAASCARSADSALTVGTVSAVPQGGVRSFSLNLAAGEGMIVDLSNLKPAAPAENEGGTEAATSKPRALRLCDNAGNVMAPQPGEVFEKGGSVRTTDDGERLHFKAARAGTYIVTVDSDDAPREILARRRTGGTSPAAVVSAQLGDAQKGITSSKAPMVFSFSGTAGQWVMLKSTSEKDTLLRLAGPDKSGEYSQIAENDDSEGLNPVVRRKLPLSGTYFVQVDSLSDEPAEFELTLNRTDAPKPPPPPSQLAAGNQLAGRLADGDAVKLYSLTVVSGHSYRLDLTAPYDGVVAIGLPNPIEPDDGGDKPDAGFSEIKSQDSGTTGTEKLTFTARSSGQLLVRVKSFGIGETDGGYTLTATDLGG